MKKLELILVCLILSMCLNVKAQVNAPYFGSQGRVSSSPVDPAKDDFNNSWNNNPQQHYYGNWQDNNYPYPNGSYSNNYIFQNSSNYLNSYIFSRSMCDGTIETVLKGKSVSVSKNDVRFHLANGQIWKQYVFFGGQVVETTTSSYSYTSYSKNQPKIKIYKDQLTNACRVMLEGNDTGIFVYREI